MRFSASMISSWSKCSLMAKYAYVDKLPELQNASATFGTCVHEALEQYNKGASVTDAAARFLYTWANPEVLGVAIDTWPKRVAYTTLRETGVRMINEYHENVRWSNREVIGVEHKFCVPFGTHELSGIVDVLQCKKGDSKKLKIVDLKTGRRPNLDNLYLNIQMTAYHYAASRREFWVGNPDYGDRYPGFPNGEELWERFKNAERTVIWHDLKANKEVNAGRRDDNDYLRLYRCCLEIEKAVEREVFVPTISGDSCLFCSFTEICRAYIPPKENEREWN